jgi:alkylated DNA repair dioxygenase AlkB
VLLCAFSDLLRLFFALLDTSFDMASASIQTIQTYGVGDSSLIPRFYTAQRAAKILTEIDEETVYLDRSDTRMRFKIYGKSHGLARNKAILCKMTERAGVVMEFYYKYSADTPPAQDWKSTVFERVAHDLEHDAGAHGQACNHVVVNQYRSGTDYIGFHSDKSKIFFPDSSVMTVSLARARTVCFASRASRARERTSSKTSCSPGPRSNRRPWPSARPHLHRWRSLR